MHTLKTSDGKRIISLDDDTVSILKSMEKETNGNWFGK